MICQKIDNLIQITEEDNSHMAIPLGLIGYMSYKTLNSNKKLKTKQKEAEKIKKETVDMVE